eukprot:m.72005 g.72005  ORF g.72005 m.72005 type:complete len:94 (+) comp12320_c1_seq1:588-869(+)
MNAYTTTKQDGTAHTHTLLDTHKDSTDSLGFEVTFLTGCDLDRRGHLDYHDHDRLARAKEQRKSYPALHLAMQLVNQWVAAVAVGACLRTTHR